MIFNFDNNFYDLNQKKKKMNRFFVIGTPYITCIEKTFLYSAENNKRFSSFTMSHHVLSNENLDVSRSLPLKFY